MSEHEKINELIKDIKFAMVTFNTQAGHLHAVPMTTQNKEFDGEIWFIGSKKSEWVENIAHNNQVNLAYSTSSSHFISIHGTANLVEDQALLDELWSPAYNAFFENGKEDPDVQLIRVDAHGAQYWESSGKLVTLFKLGKAAISGEKQQLGTSKAVEL